MTAWNDRPSRTFAETIEFLFSKTTTNEKGCIIPHLVPHKKGYIHCYPEGKQWKAHRLVYHCLVADIADGMVVMHKCDNPPCINPNHLLLGTQAQNVADMVEKGRCRGQFNLPARKVTIEMVNDWKKLRAGGMGVIDIGLQYSLSSETVRKHLKGQLVAIH